MLGVGGKEIFDGKSDFTEFGNKAKSA